MRRLFKNKSKFLAGICCLCLGVASLLAGAFSFAYAPAKAEEDVDANTGFYVEKGASFRYDTEVPAIRFAVSLTKAQWEAYKLDKEYTDDMVVKIEASIGITDRPNKDNPPSSGFARVFQDVSVKTINNYFANAENLGKPFTVKPAVILTNTWKGETTEGKTPAQLYALYANAEFHVAGIRLSVNGDVLATKDTDKNGFIDKALTLRSVRALSASLLAQGKVASEYVDTAKAFLINEDGSKAEIVKKDIKAYYDKYVDTGVIDVTEIDTATLESADKVAIGSTKVTASGVVDGKVTISEAALTLADGETYTVNYDCGDKIYSLKGLTAATEIFYQTNSKGETGVARLDARFAITAAKDAIIAKENQVVETVVDKDGVSHSMTFYSVDRGYYVLGEDIEFVSPATSYTTGNYINHNQKDLNQAAMGSYAGVFGFGGTFDGNGYTIHNLRARCGYNSQVVSGLFGALAYGATIKDVGFVSATKNAGENQRYGSILATWTGSIDTVNKDAKDGTTAKEGYNYIITKYGDKAPIQIDNCFFDIDKRTNASGQSVFETVKVYNKTYNSQGVMCVVYEGEEGLIKFTNCALDTFNNSVVYGHQEYGGYGWIGKTSTYNQLFENDGCFENCYLLSPDKSTGEVATVFERRAALLEYEDGSTAHKYTWQGDTIDGKLVFGNGTYDSTTKTVTFTKKAKELKHTTAQSKEFYAVNDHVGIANGTPVYSGLNADGKYIVEPALKDQETGEWTTTTSSGYTANVIFYRYNNVSRYDNYTDMVLNNTASTEGFNDKWSKVGGAVIWNGLAEIKNLDVTVSSQVGEVNDVIKVTAKYGEEDATSLITLSTENSDIISIDNQYKTVTLIKGGEATLRVTANGYFAEYTIVSSNTNKTAVTISSNYSEVYGLENAYSVPYVLAENGKDLVATDFLTIYRKHVGDNNATVSNVYLLDANGEKTALNAVDVKGVSQYLFENAGNVKQALSIIVDGSYGYMSFADISSVTAVIADTDGFKYIPSTATTRAGYYLLANDYNDLKINVTESTTYDDLRKYFKLPVMGANSNEVGYSFGGMDLDVLAEYSKNSTFTALKNNKAFAYRPFVGTFDGLGHTIDHLMIEPFGLLGRYQNMSQSSTLKNVKLTNVHSAYYMWTGGVNVDGYKENTNDETNAPKALLAVFENADNADYEVVTAEKQVKIENVSIEMAPSHLHRKDVNSYQGLGNSAYWSVFSMARRLSYTSATDKYSVGNMYTARWTTNKLNTNNLIIKYDMTERAGRGNEGGYMFFNTSIDNAYGNGAYRQAVWTFRDVKNTYLIVNPIATGRTPFITNNVYAGDSNNPKQALVGLPYNDYEAYLGTDASMNYSYGSYKYTMTNDNRAGYKTTAGCGYVTTTLDDATTTKEFVYLRDVDNYTPKENQTFEKLLVNDAPYCTFYKTNIYRYDTYAAMATAGVTQVGNFAITADGIVWNPAK